MGKATDYRYRFVRATIAPKKFTTRHAGRLLKILRFESCVISEVTQTVSLTGVSVLEFESCVISEVTQTMIIAFFVLGAFESCVISEVTQTIL